ncbi:NUDIX hydrolase [Lacinutrix venerupis]|uniref:NUDIX hydrolase n=1 Tax=Lacinutrix venerupis TaxID=1486034 RepID=A0AAC9LK24_9FLAO|nr:NUDIX domain-containing protein [Lacinutrix venerupis]APX99883.1 NUDIX hydrolase [Lacinutrix venerupis]
MYYIFVNNKPIILTTIVEKETDFKNFLLKDVDIEEAIKVLKKKKINSIRLIHHNEETILKKFLKKLPNVIAGGGKVYNNNNEVLFIFRNNKWDLPKGKAEKNESIEETALREVEEETGVTGLKIVKPLETTYHLFKRNDKLKIKITYWFKMKTNFKGELYPQEAEGITKVQWLNKEKSLEALNNSYSNIKLLIKSKK